jgi:hypothetical protein
MPSTDGRLAHSVNVIHLPGEDRLEDIDLLTYPFLCHELGHNLLFRHGDRFITAFREHLKLVLADVRRKTLGVRGASRQISEETTKQVHGYWNPTPNHYNWAHEIAVDAISLWLSGPAYLAALQDVMEEQGLDPRQLGQSHPPYAIRSRAVMAAAQKLDWSYYTGGIQALTDRWWSEREGQNNLLVACADPRLIDQAVSTALATCQTLSLPRCTSARLDAVERALKHGSPVDFGIDLILAAWVKGKELTETRYDEWQEVAVLDLLREITE